MKMNVNRTVVCYLVLVLLGMVASGRIIYYQYISQPTKETYSRTVRTRTIESKRGSILATDGRALAFSMTEYKICLDCSVQTDSLYKATLNPLCDSLAALVGDRTAGEYKEIIEAGRKKKSPYITLSKKSITYQEKLRASQFPMFEKGANKGGVIFEKCGVRQYPYGSLANRTLGTIMDVKEDMCGLERSCDSILGGKDGILSERRSEHKRWIKDEDSENFEPIDGADVRSTIDINIQLIAEQAMRHQIAKSNDINYGTVVVMETKTGRIRAMVNLNRGKDGKYYESLNQAINGQGEPGSVFKLATLALLLDEGKTTLNHVFSPAPSVITCGKAKPMTDNYLKKLSSVSVLEGFEMSSNNVFRKLAWDNYHKNPKEFVEKLNDKIKISYNFDFDIPGLRKGHIRHPDDLDTLGRKIWSDAELPQIAMGYASKLTPLHIINFYNAVANDGVMVRPRLIESFEKEGQVIKKYDVEEIGRVCSEKTAKELQYAMRQVVIKGTGEKVFQGCKVAIAGKTGTARVGYSKGDKGKQHKATFAGFFPYENPKYTVIAVLLSNPSDKDYYGSSWAGPVVREIAEQMYTSNPEWGTHIAETAKLPKPDKNYSLRANLFSGENERYLSEMLKTQ